MKKILAFLLVLSMALALCGCGMSEEEVYSLVDSFADNEALDREKLEQASKQSSFEQACIDKLAEYEEASDFSGACHFVTKLKNYKFSITAGIREQFLKCVDAERNMIFQEGQISRIIRYYNEIRTIIDDRGGSRLDPKNTNSRFGLDFLSCFPYEEMSNAIKTYGTGVICESGSGGYYDSHSGADEEDYWESPLTHDRENHAVAGYQHVTKTNLYAGDFDVVVTQKIFAGTSAGDQGNSVSAVLYYKGRALCDDYLSIEHFLKYCRTGNTFFIEDKEGNHILFAIEEDMIVTLQDKYEGYLYYQP